FRHFSAPPDQAARRAQPQSAGKQFCDSIAGHGKIQSGQDHAATSREIVAGTKRSGGAESQASASHGHWRAVTLSISSLAGSKETVWHDTILTHMSPEH